MPMTTWNISCHLSTDKSILNAFSSFLQMTSWKLRCYRSTDNIAYNRVWSFIKDNTSKNTLSPVKRWHPLKRVVICVPMTTWFLSCHRPWRTYFQRCHLFGDVNAYMTVSSVVPITTQIVQQEWWRMTTQKIRCCPQKRSQRVFVTSVYIFCERWARDF